MTSVVVNAGADTRTVMFRANVIAATSPCTAAAGAAPNALDFGGVTLRTTSQAESITITNNCTAGMLSLSTPSIMPAGDFVLIGDALPAALAPGQSATVMVTFAPQNMGARMARLLIPTSSGEVGIDLIGTGLGNGTTFGAPASLYACDCSSQDAPGAAVILLALVLPLVPRRRRRC